MLEDERFQIGPLGQHDRAAFSCGAEPLDRYLKHHAGQELRHRVTAVFVAFRTDAPSTIAGFYTLSMASIKPTGLPADVTKRLPRYPRLPVALVGRLAVDGCYRGQGLGELLLHDALYKSFQSKIAAMAVVVDAKDDTARQFYAHYEFRRFLDNEYRLFLHMKTIEQMFAD